jgi:hypothetical protein
MLLSLCYFERFLSHFINPRKIAAETNETMRRLTLVTIVCLPLTLFTGYFGMNFEPMWSVNHNSDILFWKIALPVMAVLIPLFTWADIMRGVHKMQKKFATRAAVKEVRGAQPVRQKHSQNHHGV